jgi:hypothetical protein
MAPRKDRIQVRTGDALAPERFRPAASPEGTVATRQNRVVDTFVAPANPLNRNAGNQLAQLANGLSSLAPNLSRFAFGRKEEENKSKFEEGVTAAQHIREQGETYKTAVDKGMIRESDNPFFVAGVKEQFGSAMAGEFGRALEMHLASKPELAESMDTDELQGTVARFQEEWLGSNVGKRDKFFDKGFAVAATRITENVLNKGAEVAAGNVEKMSVKATYQEGRDLIADAITKQKPEDWAKDYNVHLTTLRAQGRNPMQLAKATAQAFVDMALEQEDPGEAAEIVAAAKLVRIDGKPLTAYVDGELQDSFRDIGDTIISRKLARDTKTRNIKAASDKDAVEDAQIQIATLLKDGKTEDARALIRTMATKVAGSEADLSATMDRIEGTKDTDQQAVKQIASKIWHPRSNITVQDIFQMPGLDPKSTFFLVNQVQERDAKIQSATDRARADADRSITLAEKARRDRDAIYDNYQFRVEFGNIAKAKAFAADPFQNLIGGAPPDRGEQISEAESYFSRSWALYMAGEGKTATDEQRGQWLRSRVKTITDAVAEQHKGASAAKPQAKLVLNAADIAAWREKRLTDNARTHVKGMAPADIQKFYREQMVLLAKQATSNP